MPSPPPDTNSLQPLLGVAAVAGTKAAHLAKCLWPMQMLWMECAPCTKAMYPLNCTRMKTYWLLSAELVGAMACKRNKVRSVVRGMRHAQSSASALTAAVTRLPIQMQSQ